MKCRIFWSYSNLIKTQPPSISQNSYEMYAQDSTGINIKIKNIMVLQLNHLLWLSQQILLEKLKPTPICFVSYLNTSNVSNKVKMIK